MVHNHLSDNTPNADIFFESLRHLGYDNYSAIIDIIDNSIDADATVINVEIKTTHIKIIDNWIGMTSYKLDQAMKLGSRSTKGMEDLWRFWVWLITASISLGRNLKVFTREENKDLIYAEQDLDLITKESIWFTKDKWLALPSEKEEFNKYNPDGASGTIVVISKLDRITNSNISIFRSTLKKKIWQKLRRFIHDWKQIYVNTERAPEIDPFNVEGIRIHSKQNFEYKDEYWTKHNIKVRVWLLPYKSKEWNEDTKITQESQWFYMLRNDREIANWSWFGVIKNHPELNRIRAEVEFDWKLDKEFWVNFLKDWIKPTQSLKDFLRENLKNKIEDLKKIVVLERNANKSKEVSHTDSAKAITKRSKVVVSPVKTLQTVIEEPTPVFWWKYDVDISKYEWEKEWRVFRVRIDEENKVIVEWNINHPFYHRVFIEWSWNKDLLSAVDYLIFSMATAQLANTDDQSRKIIDHYNDIVSLTLRKILD